MESSNVAATRPLARFGVALLAVALACLARTLTTPLFGYRFHFLTFFPAILGSAWYGGFWPGALCTVLSALLVLTIWIKPAWVLDVDDLGDAVALVLFVGIGLAISALHEALRRERAALTAARVAAELAAGSALRASREAEKANRAKDEFLSVLSHELRTPLTAILGWTTFLRASHLDLAGEKRALEAIERNSIAQARLIEDLFDVSSIVKGKLRLDLLPIDPAPVLHAALEQVNPSIQAKGISLVTRIAPERELLCADAGRLQQILWNLLSNAVKFTPPSGRISVDLERAPSGVSIRIADTGKGISADFLPHVFDRFCQEDASSTRAHHGLGLGLSLVKSLVEMHGGTVAAESEGPGRGAAFTVRLPVQSSPACEAPAPVEAAPDEPTATPLEGVRVLVVDDEAEVRDLVVTILRERGATVFAAASTAEALGVLRSILVDVIVSDIAMPGEDGYALMAQASVLMANQQRRVPALALTGYASLSDAYRASRAGFALHVAKPITPDRLIRAVVQLAQQRA
jgi:signal transduction histidine kinase/ActR/RegA family two-component response regulator